jgi:ribosome-associated toxin RatA of RatAB toxin-antitoxin module
VSDQATERATIAAPVEAVFAIAADVEHYPDWAADIKEVEVVERDADGHVVRARFRAAAMGHSARYVLRYDHSEAPHRLTWFLEEGDIVRRLDGEYVFEANGAGGTDVTYHLVVEMAVPLPGFVKRRAEVKIVRTALEDLRDRCEA